MKEIDLDIGDIILTGKWKNKSVEVESFGTDDKGQPTVNGKAMLNFRIKKLMPGKDSKAMDEQTRLLSLAGMHPTIVHEEPVAGRSARYPADPRRHTETITEAPMNEHRKMKILAGVTPTPIQSITEADDPKKIVRDVLNQLASLKGEALNVNIDVDDRVFKLDRNNVDAHSIKEADRLFKEIDDSIMKIIKLVSNVAKNL